MATITAAMVKDLRESTGAGMMDCKAALTETNGDMEAAQDWLRKKGLSKAAKKSGRVAAEGLIGALTKGNKGVVVEVNSETDFVARNGQFQGLVKMIAQVAFDTAAVHHRNSRQLNEMVAGTCPANPNYSASAVSALALATQASARLGRPTSSPIVCAVSWSSSASCQ